MTQRRLVFVLCVWAFLGGPVVGITETGLPDAVHEVVDDVDGAGIRERGLGGHPVAGVERHRGDVVVPAESLESDGLAGGGNDLVALGAQRRDESRSHVAGGSRDEDPHCFTVGDRPPDRSRGPPPATEA